MEFQIQIGNLHTNSITASRSASRPLGKIQDLADPGSFNDQLFRAGPVIYLNFGEEAAASAAEKHENGETERVQKSEALELKMAAGVLFGLTDATSDVTFKLDAELEF